MVDNEEILLNALNTDLGAIRNFHYASEISFVLVKSKIMKERHKNAHLQII